MFAAHRVSTSPRIAFENAVRKNPASPIVEKVVDSLTRGNGSLHIRGVNLNISKKTAIACGLV